MHIMHAVKDSNQSLILITVGSRTELEFCRKFLPTSKLAKIDNNSFSYSYTPSSAKYFFLRTGIGKVNSAISTFQAIHKWHPQEVINIGTGSSVTEKPLSLFIGKMFFEWDLDLSPIGKEKEYYSPSISLLVNEGGLKSTTIATGDSFITPAKASELLGGRPSLVFDMEAAPQCFLCNKLNLPFASIKCITDNILSDPSEISKNTGEAISHIIDYLNLER
ncbi:MAG: hypothetical protein ACD_61C00007G0007 [uncultured bacterium]|nr:MAG: hypothetical protein ACD_61C00007G0007 [uncultured bacterium]